MSSSDPIAVGLVGVGAIGRHHARILKQLDSVEFVGLYDTDQESAAATAETYSIPRFDSIEDLFHRSRVVYIATPTVTHHQLAKRAILAGKHVFVEKPIAATKAQADELIELASEHAIHLVVGHIERFNPAVMWLRRNVNGDDIVSVNISRVGPRPPRVKDVGVVVDLGVHDIDLISHLTVSPISEISAFTIATYGHNEDIAQIIVRTESGVVGAINTNWITPYKSRVVQIATKELLYVADLIAERVVQYRGMDTSGTRYQVEETKPQGVEPLLAQTKAFVELLTDGTSNGIATATEASRVVELAHRCLEIA